jgi:hypothetical protein
LNDNSGSDGKEKDDNEETDENYMIRDNYYIDNDRKIRLDKLLLGFEIDAMNDSITEQEMALRAKR